MAETMKAAPRPAVGEDRRVILTHDRSVAAAHLMQIPCRIEHYAGIAHALGGNRRRSLEDLLELFPPAQKKDLIELGPDLYDFGESEAALLSETGGTTGVTLATPRSLEELRWNSNNLSDAFCRFLTRGRDRVAIVHPGQMSPFAEACGLALQSAAIPYLRIFPIANLFPYERIWEILDRHKITTLLTTPTLVYKLLYELKRIGNGRLPGSLQNTLLTGESLSDDSCANLRKIVPGVVAPFVYGSSEAATCMHGCSHNRYHPYLRDFIFELNPLPSSSLGPHHYSLYLTWLNRGVRPLVRYATNDIFSIDATCECGAPGPALRAYGSSEKLFGTVETTSLIESAVYSIDNEVYHFAIEETGPGRLTLEIVVPPEEQETAIQHQSKQVVEKLAALDAEVSVRINSLDCGFYNDAPKPKTNRASKALR